MNITYRSIALAFVLLLCTGCNSNLADVEITTKADQSSSSAALSLESPQESSHDASVLGLYPSKITVSDKFSDVIEINGELGGFFAVTFDFDSNFSISEKYLFNNNSGFSSMVSTLTLEDFRTLDEVCDYTSGALNTDNLVAKTKDVYMIATEKPLLIKDVLNCSMDQAYLYASELTLADSNQISLVQSAEAKSEDEPVILQYSEDTLIMDKYTMHVGIGETRQLVIAECPEEYVDKLLFISDNPSAATVDAAGNVKGVRNGSATVTVTVDGASGYSSVMIYVY